MAVLKQMPPLPAGAIDFNKLNDAVAAGDDAKTAIAKATGAAPEKPAAAAKAEAKTPADEPAGKANTK